MIHDTIKLPPIVKHLRLNKDCWIAGGAALELLLTGSIRPHNEFIDNDIDVFFKSKKAAAAWLLRYQGIVYTDGFEKYSGQSYYANVKFNELTYKINIVYFNFDKSPLDTILGFDLTPCQVALDYKGNIHIDQENVDDIWNRKMEFIDVDRSFQERVEYYLQISGYHDMVTSVVNNIKNPIAIATLLKNTDRIKDEIVLDAHAHAWKVLKKRIMKYQEKGFMPGESIAYAILKYEGVYENTLDS